MRMAPLTLVTGLFLVFLAIQPGLPLSSALLFLREETKERGQLGLPTTGTLESPGSLMAAPAQDPELESSTFRVNSEMVLLSVTVRDSDGLPVEGLGWDMFQVLEEGEKQTIIYFEEHESPQAIVLCLDTSSSMREGLLQEAKKAALELVERLNAQAEIALLSFNDRVTLVQNFTHSETDLAQAIRKLDASGGTALLDGLHEGVELARHHEYPRQIVVLLTDGQEQDSRTKFDEIEQLISGSGVLIYSIGVYDPAERKRFLAAGQYLQPPEFDQNLNPVWILRHWADLTGGLPFFPGNSESLRPVFADIGEDLHHFYQIGYLPPASQTPHFRKVSVRLRGQDGTGAITLRTRQGYYR